MRVLVTGAGGYIGSVLVPKLLDQNHDVIAFDRFFFGTGPLDPVADHPGLRLERGDVRTLPHARLHGCDAVCDLAALSNDPSGELSPELTLKINFEARRRLAEMAKSAGVARYVLSSSCSAYGRSGRQPVDEDAPTNPVSTYAKCNILAEQAILALDGDGFTAVAQRNGTVFGVSPRMRFDLIVNLMVLTAATQGRITVLGGGRQVRPLIHVGDVADAMIALLAAPADRVGGRIFNAALANLNARAVAMLVRQTLNFPVDIVIAPDDADKRSYAVATERMRQTVGFEPAISVEAGIRQVYQAIFDGTVEEGPKTRTVEWYRFLIDANETLRDVVLDGKVL